MWLTVKVHCRNLADDLTQWAIYTTGPKKIATDRNSKTESKQKLKWPLKDSFSSMLGLEGVSTPPHQSVDQPTKWPASRCLLLQFFSCPRAPEMQRQPRRAAVAGMCPGTEHSVCQRKKPGGDFHPIGPTAGAARRPGSGLVVGDQRWASVRQHRKDPLLSRLRSVKPHRTHTSIHTSARRCGKRRTDWRESDGVKMTTTYNKKRA